MEVCSYGCVWEGVSVPKSVCLKEREREIERDQKVNGKWDRCFIDVRVSSHLPLLSLPPHKRTHLLTPSPTHTHTKYSIHCKATFSHISGSTHFAPRMTLSFLCLLLLFSLKSVNSLERMILEATIFENSRVDESMLSFCFTEWPHCLLRLSSLSLSLSSKLNKP